MYILTESYLKVNLLWVGTDFIRAAVVGPKEQFRGCGLETQACPAEGGPWPSIGEEREPLISQGQFPHVPLFMLPVGFNATRPQRHGRLNALPKVTLGGRRPFE